MSFVYWLPNANGDWSDAADWSGGSLPTSTDFVAISTSTVQTITHSTGSGTIAGLAVGNDLLSVTGGTLSITGSTSMATGFAESGGYFSVGSSATITGNLNQTGGALIVGSTLAVSGNAQFSNGYLGGKAVAKVSGTITLSNYTIGGSAQVLNAHTAYETGNLYLDPSNGTLASLTNERGAIFDISIGNVSISSSGSLVPRITNVGTLEMTATSSITSNIHADLLSTGTVSAVSGSNLEIDGPSNSISGAITGTGQVAFGGGASTIAGGTTLSVASIAVYNNSTSLTFGGADTLAGNLSLVSGAATVALAGNVTVDGSYNQNYNSLLSVGAYTLTVDSNAQFQDYGGTPTVSGSGSLVTKGTTTVVSGGTALVVGGSATWSNAGTVLDNGSIQLGNGTVAASIVNATSAVFNLAIGPNLAISNGSTPASSFINHGTLEMTATNGVTDRIYADLSSTGTVSAVNGSNLEIDGPSNSISGAITGTGLVAFGGGASTIAAGTTLSVASIAVYDASTSLTFAGADTLAGNLSLVSGAATVALAGNVTVDGSYNQNYNSLLSVGAYTLTVDSNAQFQDYGGTPTVSGSGSLVTKGTTTVVSGGTALVVGGSATWSNAGTVLDNGSIQLGNGTVAASIVNATSAVFNLAIGPNLAISNGSTPASSFINHGTLEMTATNGVTDRIYADLSSTGTVSAVNGSNLEIDGPSNSISGAITGTGQVAFGGGASTIAGGTTLSVASIAVYNNSTSLTFGGADTLAGNLSLVSGAATVALGGNVTVDGSYNQNWNSLLSLGAYTLTVDGNAQFQDYNGTPTVSGSGSLVTKGTTTVVSGGIAAVIGGTATWSNAGTVLDNGSIQIGNGTATAASVVSRPGAVFDITAGSVVVYGGSSTLSSFVNDGTLEMTAAGTSSVTSSIYADLLSTGTVSAVAGSHLEIDGTSNMISGAITGTGQVAFGGGTSTIAAGTTISVASLAIYNTSTSLTFAGVETLAGYLGMTGSADVLALGGNVTVDGGYNQNYNSVLSLGAYTLTVDGNAQFQDYYGTPTVSGSGSLVTRGTTTVVSGGTALVVGGSATWSNAGTVLDNGSIQIGNGTATAASVVNRPGAVFDITAGSVVVYGGSSTLSSFVNDGTLEMTATGTTGVTSNIYAGLLSTGTVNAVSGSHLEIDGPSNAISGAITGTGQVAFGGGTSTIAAGTTISVASLAIYNTGTSLTFAGVETLAGYLGMTGSADVLALGGNVTVDGGYNQNYNSVLSLGAYTLTVDGNAQFQDYYGTPTVSGSGSLVTRGTTTVVSGGTALVVGGSATWSNAGTVLDNGSIQIGNGTLAAAVANAAGAVFDIGAGSIALTNGSTPASGFVNAGTLEMTVAGTSSVEVGVTNSGTILATKGTLDFSGGVAGTGALDVESGGSLGFSGNVQSTETVNFLDATGTMEITLPSATAFGAEINGFVAGDTIDLTNISNATGTFSGGVLNFINNSSHGTVATLHFSGTPTFAFASDGHGGTLITDPGSTSRIEHGSLAEIATRIQRTWEPSNQLEQSTTLFCNGTAFDKDLGAPSARTQPEHYSQVEGPHGFLFTHL